LVVFWKQLGTLHFPDPPFQPLVYLLRLIHRKRLSFFLVEMGDDYKFFRGGFDLKTYGSFKDQFSPVDAFQVSN